MGTAGRTRLPCVHAMQGSLPLDTIDSCFCKMLGGSPRKETVRFIFTCI